MMTVHRQRGATIGTLTVVAWLVAAAASPGAQSSGYPTKPRPLPETEEIALATSAAPEEVSAQATVYVLRATGPAKAREGTNGCTCLVSRDLHEGSLYPICYDREASTSAFQQELMELRLRFEGRAEEEIKRAVVAAYASGTLHAPNRPAMIYMMSPRQVLFSSPFAEGVNVGAWHPHLMIAMPFATSEQFGLSPNPSIDAFQLERSGEAGAQLIVPLTRWADASEAAKP